MSTAVMPRWRVWLLAFRPFALTASFIPVTLGSILAWQEGVFSFFAYLLAVTGGVLLQVGTNAVNTYYDYLTGVDTVANKGKSQPFLVLGWLQPGQLLQGGFLAFALATFVGLFLISLRGWPILVLGIIGLVGGYGYTARPLAYKYQGLGVPLVFLLMGPLMVIGGYLVQTGSSGWLPVLASLPVGFLVAAILHGNDLRDIEADREAAVKTFSHHLKTKAPDFYYFLIGGAYTSLLLLVVFRILPWPALLPLLTFPQGLRLVGMVRGGFAGNPALLEPVEPLTARLHLIFGLLFIAGLLLAGL